MKFKSADLILNTTWTIASVLSKLTQFCKDTLTEEESETLYQEQNKILGKFQVEGDDIVQKMQTICDSKMMLHPKIAAKIVNQNRYLSEKDSPCGNYNLNKKQHILYLAICEAHSQKQYEHIS